MGLSLVSKTEVLNKNFIGIPCVANATIGIKQDLFFLPKIVQVNVFDKNKTPVVSESIGMNIKDFKLTCQKNSFVELKMNFDKEIKEITGLPQNLALYNDCIKGVIQTSGEYLITICFKDDTDYKFILEVPNLQRTL